MAEQYIRTAYPDGNVVLSNVRNKKSNKNYTLTKVTTYADGTAMTDAKVSGDRVVYRKLVTTENGTEYFRMNIDGEIPLSDYGKGLSGLTNLISKTLFPIKTIVIDGVIDLGGASYTIPANLVFKFKGGLFKNGTLIGNQTAIIADRSQIFDNVNLCYVKDSNGRYLYEANTDMVASGQLDMDTDGLWTVAYKSGYVVPRRFRYLNDIDTLIPLGAKVNPADIFDVGLKLNTASTFFVREVYPEWFGAVVDGVTDNYLPTQTAIDFASAVGCGVVSFAGNKKFYTLTKSLFLREGTKLQGDRFATANSGGTNLRWTGNCEAGVRMIRKPQVEISGIMFSCYGVTVKNAIVNFESHNMRIANGYCVGDFTNAGILGSGFLYPIVYKFNFSLNSETAWALMFREDVYQVGYYGVNVGQIQNCNISARNSISHNGGDLTVVDCDIEGDIKERGAIEIGYYTSSNTSFRLVNSYFECTPKTGVQETALIRIKNGSNITAHGNQIFGKGDRTLMDVSFIAPLQGLTTAYAKLDITGGNQINRFNTVFKNVLPGANFYHTEHGNQYNSVENIFNYVRGTGLTDAVYTEANVNSVVYYDVKESTNDVYFDKKNKLAFNHGKLYSSNFWVDKTKRNGVLSIAFGNRVAWSVNEDTTITNIMNSGKIKGTPVFFVNNSDGKVTFQHNRPYKWGMFEVTESGYGYPEDTPTITVSNHGNLILVPRVENGIITDVTVTRSDVVTDSPTITITDKKGGTGATFELVKNAQNHVTSANVLTGGSGYGGPTVNITNSGNTTKIFPLIKNGRLLAVFFNFNDTLPASINDVEFSVTSNPAPVTTAKFRTDISGGIISPTGKNIVLVRNDSVEGYVNNNGLLIITKVSRFTETGWTTGTTPQRPADTTLLTTGHTYFDTTLGRSVEWNGSAWVNSDPDATTAVRGLVLKAAAVPDIATADATDLPTATTLANANKAKMNALLAALRTAGLLT